MTLPATRSAGWRVGVLRGVPIYLGRSWLLIAAVIVVLFGPVARNILPAVGQWSYVVALGFALLLLVSVLVHEAAHALVGQACGYRVARIVADFWGGHTAYDSTDATPGRSALVAIAGPLANGALAAAGWLALQAAEGDVTRLLLAGFTYANGFVALFNLLPGLPLDGGFLVDSAVWAATGSRGAGMIVAGWCGRLVTLALVWWAVGIPLASGQQPTLTRIAYAVLLGSFLWFGATEAIKVGRARRRLERVPVSQVLSPAVVVRADDLLDQVPTVHGTVVAVDDSGHPVGVLDPDAAGRVPVQGRAGTPVSAVLRRMPPEWSVAGEPDDALTDTVVALQSHHLPVVVIRGRDGTIRGVVRAADL